MEAAKRSHLSRVVEKIDQNKKYADRLGIKNKSNLKASEMEGRKKC